MSSAETVTVEAPERPTDSHGALVSRWTWNMSSRMAVRFASKVSDKRSAVGSAGSNSSGCACRAQSVLRVRNSERNDRAIMCQLCCGATERSTSSSPSDGTTPFVRSASDAANPSSSRPMSARRSENSSQTYTRSLCRARYVSTARVLVCTCPESIVISTWFIAAGITRSAIVGVNASPESDAARAMW
eukprot:Amastigsp_a511279_5.p2 type:complete len:188 gc:universal Amastigsp_a511279_5:607-44(-)